MTGGGKWKVGRGQVTDDTELAMCLIHGLTEANGKLSLDTLAKHYADWYRYGHFSMGLTTQNAFGPAKNIENGPYSDLFIQAAKKYNSLS